MTSEQFSDRFLADFDLHSAGQVFEYNVAQISQQYDVAREDVPELLDTMSEYRLIELSAYDGERQKLRFEWPDAHSFYFNTSFGGSFRIKRLVKGKDVAELNRRKPIGFVPPKT